MLDNKDILNFLMDDLDSGLKSKLEIAKKDANTSKDLADMKQIWDLADELTDYQQFDTDAAWMSFEEEIENETPLGSKIIDIRPTAEKIDIAQPPRSKFWSFIAVAASLALLITAAFLLTRQDEFLYVKGFEQNESTILPDGSIVDLLSDESMLKYPRTFEGREERRIYIEGDATVDVVTDSFKVFYVQNYKAQVEAFGTIFKIESDSTLSVLENVEGKMGLFEMANLDNGARLENPGDKAEFDGGPVKMIPAYVEPPPPPDTPGIYRPIMDITDSLTLKYPKFVAYLVPPNRESKGMVKVLLGQPLAAILAQLDSTANIIYIKDGPYYTITTFTPK